MPKFLGIDYGEKRIGLAVAENYDSARPVDTVGSLDELVKFIRDQGPFDSIVMGLPRGIDGQDTAQTLKVREAGSDLSDQLGIELEYTDEFDTSNLARKRLIDSGRSFSREEIDAESAAIILNDFLVGQD